MNSCYVYCNVVGPVCGDLDLGIVGLDTFSEHGQVSIFTLINAHCLLDAPLVTTYVA